MSVYRAVAVATILVVVAVATGELAAQAKTEPRTAHGWFAASVTLSGYILGGGVEGERWRVGPELLRSHAGGLTDQQLHERLLSGAAALLLLNHTMYVKAGLGYGRRWTDYAASVRAPFFQLGGGLVVPPRTVMGLRLSLDFIQSAATPAGQYSYSILIGAGLIIH